MKTIIITGHRDVCYLSVKKELTKLLDRAKSSGFERVISGMARGSDMIAAEVALELDMKLTAAIPYVGHYLRRRDQKDYFRILAHPNTDIQFVSEEAYTKEALFARNRWMVEKGFVQTDFVLAIWRESFKSGTGHCVKFAKEKGLNIFVLNPDTLKTKKFQWNDYS